VKVGSGAFMPTVKAATELATMMAAIGKHARRRVVALISDMNQPLGHAVGNALEVREAIDTLRGGGPAGFREHCLVVAGHLLRLAGGARTEKAARARLEAALANGSAWEKFRQLVRAQGGDVSMIDDPSRLPTARLIATIEAPRAGYLAQVNAREIGLSAVDLGAGRATKGDTIDHAVGLIIHHAVGDKITKGEPLFTIHANDEARLAAARERVLAAHQFRRERVKRLPLFYKTIGA
jgi:pyrimidine-nucleoside phosphorylase